MKKKIFSVVFVAAVAATAAWNFGQSNEEMALTDVALSNVEALASSEGTGDCIIANCYWSSGSYCNYTCNGSSYSSSNMKSKN